MNEEMLKIIGILVVIGVIIFLGVKFLKIQTKVMEGLTNPSDSSSNGEAGSASQYATQLQNQVTQMHDALLITKYRKDYENIILHMDDYINLLMLKTVLNMKVSDANSDGISFNVLYILNSSKQALNNVMKYVDSQ
jgi:PHD/YefM family antitoxin component YafN of YafNO toxin-antitoxin module